MYIPTRSGGRGGRDSNPQQGLGEVIQTSRVPDLSNPVVKVMFYCQKREGRGGCLFRSQGKSFMLSCSLPFILINNLYRFFAPVITLSSDFSLFVFIEYSYSVFASKVICVCMFVCKMFDQWHIPTFRRFGEPSKALPLLYGFYIQSFH